MLKAITLDIPSLNFHGDIEFSKGLNVITGESGTGKSLILEAISHVFGRKTPRFSKLDKYTISAIVEIPPDILHRLADMGLELSDKEVSVFINKRERATYRLNGVLLSWSTACSLFCNLLSVVSVDERGMLKQESVRLSILDRFVDRKLLDELSHWYNTYSSLIQDLERVNYNISILEEKYLSLRELSEEIASVQHYIDEYESLLELAEKLKQSEKVLTLASHVKDILKEGDDSVWNAIAKVEDDIAQLEIDMNMDCIYDVISDIMEKLDELVREYQYSSLSLDEVENIIWRIQRLMRKYNTDIEGLKKILLEIDDTDNLLREKRLKNKKLEEELSRAELEYHKVAEKLSASRQKAANKINTYFSEHGKELVGGHVEVIVNSEKKISPVGYDKVDFVFRVSENRVMPVYEIASSGELSRILLLLYTLLTPEQKILIFDEIDAGTSGNVAATIGLFLRQLSRKVQLIVSTHSQFIAAAADTHFIVEDLSFRKQVKMIEGDHRVKEIARLIDGGSERAYSVALELINSYRRGDTYG